MHEKKKFDTINTTEFITLLEKSVKHHPNSSIKNISKFLKSWTTLRGINSLNFQTIADKKGKVIQENVGSADGFKEYSVTLTCFK